MPEDTRRLEHLLELREQAFAEMAAAELEFGRLRVHVERMESDLRIGLPESPEYQPTKGRRLPQAEARLIELFSELLKLEDKIKAEKGL